MRSLWFILAIIIAVTDQASKFFISSNLNLNEPVPVIQNFFHLALVHNTGVAFGLLKNSTLFFAGISLVAVLFIIFYLTRRTDKNFTFKLGLTMILGGAIGNLIDRVRLGYVIDFLDFLVWPVFNIADSCITIGAVLILVSIFIHKRTAQ
ncbi:MAG: signal peptidase II [Candidatus Omnitrophica bacterium]|nr:signal peptidase II [Candidatus Omnitrophota bacterium]